jgi:FkbM family methyltransferase
MIMSNRAKYALAKFISDVRPTLFYYRADEQARNGLRVRKAGDILEVVDDKAKKLIRINAGNAVHLPDMIESFDYYTSSAAPVALRYNGDVYDLTDFSTPRLHNVAGFEDFPVMCPSSTEPYSTTLQYLDFARLKRGSNVIDLGTYSALTAIAFSKEIREEGRVLALEPDPINYRSAEYNLAMHKKVNGLDNVTLLPMAASDKDGELELSSEGTMGSALVSIVGGYRGVTVKVQARTLMTLAEEFGLRTVEFVKIDIEGAEMFVVPQSAEFFAKYKPRLIIEGHAVNGVSTIGPLVTFLHNVGYETQVEGQPGLTLSLILAAPK